MKKTYERIINHGPYQAEIYDNCYAVIEAKKDRSKFRVRVDGTKWVGNTGGYYQYVTYLTRNQGRLLIKNYRRCHIANKKGAYQSDPFDCIIFATESNI